MKTLITAIEKSEREYSAALERLRDLDKDGEANTEAHQLREAIELVRCLRRLLNGRTVNEVYKAFGAPGDFGYDTPIGDALARLYRSEGS